MSYRRRLAGMLAAAVIVTIGSVAVDQVDRSDAPLDVIRSSPALKLLPHGTIVINRVTQKRAHGLDGTAPAAVSLNAQSTSTVLQVRNYYLEQLTRLGFTSRPPAGAPVGLVFDVYVKGPLRAEISIETEASRHLQPGKRSAFQYALTD